jgi:type II secretion system protein G
MVKYSHYVSFLFVIFCFWNANASSHQQSPSHRVHFDSEQISLSIELYKIENGHYPSNAQGLEILLGNESETDYTEAMIRRLPSDPWGNDYQYKTPGKMNKDSFDVWSYGADAKEGGTGHDTDCGNWKNDLCSPPKSWVPDGLVIILLAAASGFILGLPLYLVRTIQLYIHNRVIKDSIVGFHLYMMLYLSAVFVLLSLLMPTII